MNKRLPGCGKPINTKYGDKRPHIEDRRTRDHVVPLSRGGADTRENKVDCCSGCNRLKGSLTGAEFMWLSDDRQARKRANVLFQRFFKAQQHGRYRRAVW